ncbi:MULTISPECIES: hypothetical protein [Tsukamurella]|uniref:Uncharacterized protein n=2 Tax=Tsukamurella TaxID=2060 RepID=A0A5C5RYL5_9ACTN|nr:MULTISPECIES: hypothetical protein [Tsukamurella]NMD57337.1 hypothetical protein [Tsukamurella columbiensis]TWS27762.1 hypothetical protein FK530_16530 [Tsukamurella conjunctivitidis]
MTEWIEVLKSLVDGPGLPVHGIVRTRNAEALGRTETVGFIGAPPMWVGIGGDDVRVWRDGRRVRVELPDGSPYFISDGVTSWQFDDAETPPTFVGADRVYYHGPGAELLISRNAQDWLRGDDFTQPTRPVAEIEFLGRDCWSVELAPPPHKPAPLQMIVDRQSGAVLQQGSEEFDVSVEFTSLDVGGQVDDSLFTWDGAAVSLDERRAVDARAERAAYEEAQADRLAWLESDLGARSLNIRVPVELAITDVYELDEGDGSYFVRIRSGSGAHIEGCLWRRPHQPGRWRIDSTDHTVHHWSAAGFDWAVWLYGLDVNGDVLVQLQEQLHPSESATGSYSSR